MLRRIFAPLGLALAIVAATVTAIVSPASAGYSNCVVPSSWTNYMTGNTFYRQNVIWHPRSNINRETCWLIGVEGDSSNWRFRVHVQDKIDISTTCGDSCVSDNEGTSAVQWHYCDNSTPFTNIVWDWYAGNTMYNESNNGQIWLSPWMNAGANGHPSDFCTRLWATTRYQLPTFNWETKLFLYPNNNTGVSWWY